MRWLGLFIAVLSMGFWPAAARAQSPADPFTAVLGRLDALEREFKSYAIQENGTAHSD